MAEDKKKRGHGRPKGSLSTKTVEAKLLREQLEEKVAKRFGPLVDSKLALAEGHNVMMVRDWVFKGGKRERTGPWVQITSKVEVERLLNGPQTGDDYYQIWTKSPDGRSSEYLIDQVIGKPKDKLELSTDPKLESSLEKLIAVLS